MRKTSLFVTLLMVFLLLISCSMDVEEPVVEDVPPVEVPEVTKKDVADVKIKISSTTLPPQRKPCRRGNNAELRAYAAQ